MCIKNAEVRLSDSQNTKRKHRYTMEAIKIRGTWIGCNTMLANAVIKTLLLSNKLAPFALGKEVIAEHKYGSHRFDFALKQNEKVTEIIEVKTVTTSSDWFDIEKTTQSAREYQRKLPSEKPIECRKPCTPLFPDSESIRATKHLKLLDQISDKYKVHLVYFVSRGDVTGSAQPSQACDPVYFQAFHEIRNIKVHTLHVNFDMENCQNSFLYLNEIV